MHKPALSKPVPYLPPPPPKDDSVQNIFSAEVVHWKLQNIKKIKDLSKWREWSTQCLRIERFTTVQMSEEYEEILWGNEYYLIIFFTVVIVSWIYT